MSAASAVSPVRVGQSSQLPPAGTHAHANTVASKIRANGSACIRVLTGNMSPWIRSGDQVFVRRWDINQIVPGDVILFERNEEFFVHRVLRTERQPNGDATLVTKGDALSTDDGVVTAAEFLGRATRIHRKNRHVDIESLGQTILSRVLAKISRVTFLIYSPLGIVSSQLRAILRS